MILKTVGAVGSYEVLYDIVVSLLRRIPTLLNFFGTAPTEAIQILSLVVIVLFAGVVIEVFDLLKKFKEWLDSKL